jgi:TetR/AcrR family transcriptional regulator, mexCD-oprJ operon repressor
MTVRERVPVVSAPGSRKAPPARPQRADARRNVAAILDAARQCLIESPEASVGEIAEAAGVGRVTLYGHFKTRAELVDAVFTRNIAEARAVLEATDTTGDPSDALVRLVSASWEIVDQSRSVLRAAQRELPPERIRSAHDRILRRVQTLIERGQRAGVFRTDLPKSWLVTTAFSLMHSAAEDRNAGRLDATDGARIISATILAAFTAPGERVPG